MLVLPSQTYRAKEFLDAATRLGVDVVSASDTVQAMAASSPGRFLVLPLQDPKAAARIVDRFAKKTPIDAIIAVDDESALTAAYAAEQLGIAKNPPSAIEATRDKAKMRRLLSKADISQPGFAIVEASDNEAEKVVYTAELFGYPVVIKPVSLSASRGVERADNADDARRAATRVRAVALSAGCAPDEPLLVERYIPGDEIALEGMLTDGALRTLAIFDKPEPLTGPYFEETIYVTPSRHNPELLGRAEEELAQRLRGDRARRRPAARRGATGALRHGSRRHRRRSRGCRTHDRRKVLESAAFRVRPFARRTRAFARARNRRHALSREAPRRA